MIMQVLMRGGPASTRAINVSPAGARVAVLLVASLVAALTAAPATLAGDDKKPTHAEFQWEETTYKDGKVVNVRRGKKGEEPYRQGYVDKKVGPLAPEPGPPPGVIPAISGSPAAKGGLAASAGAAFTGETGEEAYGGNCKTVRVSEDGRGFSYFNTLYRFWLANYFCWDYPRITSFGGWSYFTDREGIDVVSVGGGGYWYDWRGSERGGHYSMRQAHVRNCPGFLGFVPFGPDCTGSQYPTVEIWVNGNGAWMGHGYGGGYLWS